MRKKTRSVQFTLFISFFAILTITFSTYTFYYIGSESNNIRMRAYDTIEQNVLTVSSFVDSEINSLDTVAQNIAYSNLVKDHFYDYLNMPTDTLKGNYDSMQNTKVLTDLLISIIGPNRPVDQIYLYSLDAGCFGSGLDNSASNTKVADMEWYAYLHNSDVNKVIFCSKDPRLEKYYSYKEGSYFLTYCLQFNKSLFKDAQGIVEVKKSAANFVNNIERMSSSEYQEVISIYDNNGNLVYPLGEIDKNAQNLKSHNDDNDSVANSGVHFFINDNNDHVFTYTSDYSGFTTIISVDNNVLLRPINAFAKTNLLIFLLFLGCSFGLSYIVSKIITDPIMKMYSQVQSFEMSEKSPEDNPEATSAASEFKMVDTHILELNTLYSALVEMQNRNRLSMEREIALHNQEMQSRMLALQSQMNPHFLYNSLATLQSMADEGMNDKIINMCQTISRILRYISSDKQLLVTLEEDLRHMDDYLQCMKIRYDDDLDYKIDIPDEMNSILIPKLCLQLIVENSIKYATKSVRPPWKIEISGTVTNTYWEIRIIDNGAGFKDEDIDSINEKIEYINETSLLPSLELNGMGLMNIYMRFKTLYKGNHIFRIGNLATGGAIVTIGGDIYREGENHE